MLSGKSSYLGDQITFVVEKKIAVIGSYAGSLISFRGDLLCDLKRNNYEVIVLLPGISEYPKVVSQLKKMKIDFFEIPLKGNRLDLLSDIKYLITIYRILKREQVNMLFLYTIKPVIYGSLAGRLLGISKIFSMITGVGFIFSGKKSFKGTIIKLIVQMLYRFAFTFNKILYFQNPDDLKLFTDLKLVKRKTTLITNGSGVDLNYYAQVPIVDKGINFLFIGRLLGQKGIREFVSAAEEIKAFNLDVSFSVCGWIDESPDAIKQAELDNWILKDTVKFLGKMEDVRPAIAESSVMVLPSYREGTPRSVLEAMSMGRPIITSNVPGCRETVLDGINGYLVEHKSTRSLVAAMKKIIMNPNTIPMMGRNSRVIAAEKFNVTKVNKAILESMDT